MQGPFAWRLVAVSTVERWHASADVDYFEGTHDGFERPAVHAEVARSVLYAKVGYWIVRDLVTATSRFKAVGTLQCAAGLTLDAVADNAFTVRAAERDVLRIRVLGPDATSSIEPGWVSPAYGVKIASPRLCVSVSAAGPASWETVLASPRLEAQVARRRGVSGDIVEVRHGMFVDITVFADGGEHAPMEGVETDADVFFLRRLTANGAPCEVFASGATRLTVDGITVATSHLPGVFVAVREADAWRLQAVGTTAPALAARDSLGSAHQRRGDLPVTPGAGFPYHSS